MSAGQAKHARCEGEARARLHGLPRDRVVEIQRARMLTAAAEVVAEFGYGGMTTARVSSRAGVSRKTFYDLFADREDCFLAVFDDTVAQVAAVAAPAYEREGCWREKVRGGLSSVLRFIGDEPVLGALVIVDALSAGPRVLARRAQWLETVAGIVDRGRSEMKAGAGPLADPGRSALTAEGVVGAVFSVLHSRLLERDRGPLPELLNPLMAMIVLPYLGPAAAKKERARPTLKAPRAASKKVGDPLAALNMRITHRTLLVLAAIAERGGQGASPCNREVAEDAGITDPGQISKLLVRLERLGLIENTGDGRALGERNA
jgi:AcrR family transcriptional regulator